MVVVAVVVVVLMVVVVVVVVVVVAVAAAVVAVVGTRRRSASPQKLCRSIPFPKGRLAVAHFSKSMLLVFRENEYVTSVPKI